MTYARIRGIGGNIPNALPSKWESMPSTGKRMYILLLGAILLSGLAAMLPLGWMGSDALSSSYLEYGIRDTANNAKLFRSALAAQLDHPGGGSISAIINEARRYTNERFDVFDFEGDLMGEPDKRAEFITNHMDRPEVAAALAGEVGVDIRTSMSMGDEWIYVAVPLEGKEGMMAVRAATSLSDMKERLSLWWRRVAIGCFLALTVLLVFALVVARALSRPIEVVAAGARHFARGELNHRLPRIGTSEVIELVDALNSMAWELDHRFRQINRQRVELRAVVSAMGEGVLALTPDGRVILANPAAAALLDLPKEVTGKPLGELTRQTQFLHLIYDATGSEQPLEREITLSSRDGALLVQAQAGPVMARDTEIGILAVFRDVTRLRRLEKVRRDFIANVSHELRTPITTIQGCLETYLDDDSGDPAERRGLLEMALRNSLRMSNVVTDLLLLSSMENADSARGAGKSRVRLTEVLEDAVSCCLAAADNRGVRIAIVCPGDLRAVMNPRLMTTAVSNLVDNAIKYGPENGEVTVSAERAGGFVRIGVRDWGAGVGEEHRNRVFERFYRVEAGSNALGTGLGLAIVKHIASAHGGAASVKPAEGGGSLFFIAIPDPDE